MKLKFIFCVSLLFCLSSKLFSQIAITEVYYDTPFNEKLKFGNETNGYVNAIKHHRGEFVEIYNYSDKDINLKGWYLSDNVGVFWFPEKIIKSGQFMVVAYSTLPYNRTEFDRLFTTTAGKGDQIILQDKIMLRNHKEKLFLGYTLNYYNLLSKSTVGWEFQQQYQGEKVPTNFIHDIWATPEMFYSVNSLQLNSQNNYMEATPNPLDAIYKPPIQSYDALVKNDYQNYYSFLDWSENVKKIVEAICGISIQKVEQSPNGTYNSGGKCFTYDTAGNRTIATDCSATNPNTSNNGYTSDELEAIKNSIAVYPNPATSNNNNVVNISWSGVAINKINNLKVYTSGAGLVYGFTPTNGINSTSFSLQGQLPGVFVANFTLNTGQVISKNILKW